MIIIIIIMRSLKELVIFKDMYANPSMKLIRRSDTNYIIEKLML